MTSDASGNIIIGSLIADSYSTVIVDLLGCSTTDNGPYVLTDPAAPTFTISTSDPTSCGGADGSITISGLNGSTTYTISYISNSGIVGPSTLTSDASGNINIGSLVADSYSTFVVDLIGCNTTDNGPYVLTDPAAPTFTITTSDPTSCGGTDGSITISGLVGSVSYNVTYDDPTGTIGPSVLTTDASGNITLSGLGSGNYQSFIIELYGCSTTDNGPYTLSDPTVPNAPTAGTDMTYCEGDALSDMTAGGGSGIFNWYDDAGLTNNIGTGSTLTPTITSTGTTTYYVTETENGCTGSASTVIISIDALPTIADAGNDTSICDTISSIVFNGNTPIIGSGIWTISTGLGVFTDSTLENTSVSGFAIGINEFTWSISNGICPASTSIVTISSEECVIPEIELVVPSGFTPDNSPPNDTWEIIGIEQYPDCQVDIYNKWGNKIFSSKGYNEFWDGTYNGKPLPVSTYYYVIVLNDGSTPLKGTITIIK
jgi:gliding motility-associated-like protein